MLEVRKMQHELSFDEVTTLINLHTHNQSRMTTLLEYYNGRSISLESMPKKADGKADNRIAYPFAYLISSTICGFLNVPPTVRCEDAEIQELIDNVFKYNDAPKQITSEILDSSIWGCAVEQMYLHEGTTRFKRIDARDVIVVRSSDIIGDIFLVIKHWKTDEIGEESQRR